MKWNMKWDEKSKIIPFIMHVEIKWCGGKDENFTQVYTNKIYLLSWPINSQFDFFSQFTLYFVKLPYASIFPDI